jgi:hypothetical protein
MSISKRFMRATLLVVSKAGNFLVDLPEEPASPRSKVVLFPETGEIRPAQQEGYIHGAIGGRCIWRIDGNVRQVDPTK